MPKRCLRRMPAPFLQFGCIPSRLHTTLTSRLKWNEVELISGFRHNCPGLPPWNASALRTWLRNLAESWNCTIRSLILLLPSRDEFVLCFLSCASDGFLCIFPRLGLPVVAVKPLRSQASFLLLDPARSHELSVRICHVSARNENTGKRTMIASMSALRIFHIDRLPPSNRNGAASPLLCLFENPNISWVKVEAALITLTQLRNNIQTIFCNAY